MRPQPGVFIASMSLGVSAMIAESIKAARPVVMKVCSRRGRCVVRVSSKERRSLLSCNTEASGS